MTESEILSMINRNVSNLTQEVISIKASVAIIEDNTEISVTNGGNIEVTMKTNTLLKHLYEQTKEGGGIDKKFDACRDRNSAQKKLTMWDQKTAVWFSLAGRVVVALVVIYSLMELTSLKKVIDKVQTEVGVTK